MNSKVSEALVWAVNRHGPQTYGPHPYVKHLLDVLRIVTDHFPDSEDLAVAACLHDVVEDTSAELTDVVSQFGDEVGQLVWAVSSTAESRKKRVLDVIGRLKMTKHAIPLKLADRLANVTSCWETRNTLLFAYHREHKQMREALFDPQADVQIQKMWFKLDDLLGIR